MQSGELSNHLRRKIDHNVIKFKPAKVVELFFTLEILELVWDTYDISKNIIQITESKLGEYKF
jgi:hypothetical protein